MNIGNNNANKNDPPQKLSHKYRDGVATKRQPQNSTFIHWTVKLITSLIANEACWLRDNICSHAPHPAPHPAVACERQDQPLFWFQWSYYESGVFVRLLCLCIDIYYDYACAWHMGKRGFVWVMNSSFVLRFS